MAYKNALAGLDHGGGKAVIIGDPGTLKSEALLRALTARFIESLGRALHHRPCDIGTLQRGHGTSSAGSPRHVTGAERVPNGGGGRLVRAPPRSGCSRGHAGRPAEHRWGAGASLDGRLVGVERRWARSGGRLVAPAGRGPGRPWWSCDVDPGRSQPGPWRRIRVCRWRGSRAELPGPPTVDVYAPLARLGGALDR